MSCILHYSEIDGSKEYVVLSECEDTPELRDENLISGFEFYRSYEIDIDLGTLPTDRRLEPS